MKGITKTTGAIYNLLLSIWLRLWLIFHSHKRIVTSREYLEWLINSK
jgi:hypothetical protein